MVNLRRRLFIAAQGVLFVTSLAIISAIILRLRLVVPSTPRPDVTPMAAEDPAYQAAMQLAQKGQFGRALAAFKVIARQRPNTDVGALAAYQTGYCYLALKDKRRAIAAFRRFRQKYPQSYLTAVAQGEIERLTGKKPASPPKQHAHPQGQSDCGPEALLMACQSLGVAARVEELVKLCGTDKSGTTMAGLARAARKKGLVAKGLQVDVKYLQRRLPLPALAWVNRNHWVAVLKAEDGKVTLFDPAKDKEETVSLDEFCRVWDGYVLTVQKRQVKKRNSG